MEKTHTTSERSAALMPAPASNSRRNFVALMYLASHALRPVPEDLERADAQVLLHAPTVHETWASIGGPSNRLRVRDALGLKRASERTMGARAFFVAADEILTALRRRFDVLPATSTRNGPRNLDLYRLHLVTSDNADLWIKVVQHAFTVAFPGHQPPGDLAGVRFLVADLGFDLDTELPRELLRQDAAPVVVHDDDDEDDEDDSAPADGDDDRLCLGRCAEVLPASAFRLRTGRGRARHFERCIACTRADRRDNYARDPERFRDEQRRTRATLAERTDREVTDAQARYIERHGSKRCPDCARDYAFDAAAHPPGHVAFPFATDDTQHSGFASICRACERRRATARRGAEYRV